MTHTPGLWLRDKSKDNASGEAWRSAYTGEIKWKPVEVSLEAVLFNDIARARAAIAKAEGGSK